MTTSCGKRCAWRAPSASSPTRRRASTRWSASAASASAAGQRQRIALARALVRRPALLLLDDTTSALDPATEGAVLGNLRGVLTGTTVLMVASRPSTIALADEVVYLAAGEVVDHGPHSALMSRQPGYRALVEAFETDRRSAGDEAEVYAGGGGGGAAGGG